MAHKQQTEFCRRMVAEHPDRFFGKRVLDVGSRDINGNNRHLLTDCDYVGCDAVAGPNVDVVSCAHELPSTIGKFGLIISTEMLEHDPNWEESVRRCIGLLADDGAFLMTCATTGRRVHGISAYSIGTEYYRNITKEEFLRVADGLDTIAVEVNHQHHDLYYFGIKR